MASLIRVSDAASLGLHAMALLAGSTGRVTARALARALRASEAHLAKVLGRLERAGFIRGKRGPSGGFVLARPADRVTLGDIYEEIEGRIRETPCLLAHPACTGTCLFGGVIGDTDRRFREHIARTRLSDVGPLMRPLQTKRNGRSTPGR